MNQPATTRAIFLASMLFGCSAFASDINKCVAPSGSVILTDAPCPSDTETVKVLSGPASVPVQTEETSAPPAPLAAQRYTVGRLPPRYVNLPFARPVRPLARDVATLRAARDNLHQLDNAAQALRAQRLVTLN